MNLQALQQTILISCKLGLLTELLSILLDGSVFEDAPSMLIVGANCEFFVLQSSPNEDGE